MWYKWLLGGTVVALIPVVIFAIMSIVSRRPTNLGVKEGRLAPCPASPNCVSTQADDADHRMNPIPFTGSTAETRQRLKQVIAGLPRAVVVTETDDYLHVECTSLLFRFVDDVEFWIDVSNGLIHFRSASRAGRSDFGVNRARMEAIRNALEKVE